MPLEVPRVSDVVPAGLTHVVLAAGLIPIILATRSFSLRTATAADFMSRSTSLPDAIPVIETPIRASFSVFRAQTSLK